jgi:hypothetical protein
MNDRGSDRTRGWYSILDSEEFWVWGDFANGIYLESKTPTPPNIFIKVLFRLLASIAIAL